MKTFRKNQKVTHVEHGPGIVKKLRYNDTQGYIDFGGFGYWYRADNTVIKHGVNTCTPKQTPEAIKVLVEVQKLQQMVKDDMKDTDPLQSDFSKGCNAYAKMIDGRIEAILQGAKF